MDISNVMRINNAESFANIGGKHKPLRWNSKIQFECRNALFKLIVSSGECWVEADENLSVPTEVFEVDGFAASLVLGQASFYHKQ